MCLIFPPYYDTGKECIMLITKSYSTLLLSAKTMFWLGKIKVACGPSRSQIGIQSSTLLLFNINMYLQTYS